MLLLTASITSLSVDARCYDAMTPTAALSNFRVLNAIDEVQDLRTGLIWKRCAEGKRIDKNTGFCSGSNQRYDWQGALQQAEQVATDSGLAWRLPSIKELNGIMEYACKPRVNGLFGVYQEVWSSTPYAGFGGSDNSYVNDFNTSSLRRERSGNSMFEVLLVREPQAPAI